MRYDISGHPLLTGEAAEMGPESLAAHTEVAEEVLGLLTYPEFGVDTDEWKSARNAVAIQVSYQVECGMDAFITASLTRGGRSKTFRGRSKMPVVHAMAKKIANRIRPYEESTQ